MELWLIIIIAAASGALTAGMVIFFSRGDYSYHEQLVKEAGSDEERELFKAKLLEVVRPAPIHNILLGIGCAVVSGVLMYLHSYREIYIALSIPLVAVNAYFDGVSKKGYSILGFVFFVGSAVYYFIAQRSSAIPGVMALVCAAFGYLTGGKGIGKLDGVYFGGMVLAIACVCNKKIAGWILLLGLSAIFVFVFGVIKFLIAKRKDKSLKFSSYRVCAMPSIAAAFCITMAIS